MILLLFGFLFLLLGLVSEYIAMIYEESRRRPSFIVRGTHGIAGHPTTDATASSRITEPVGAMAPAGHRGGVSA